MSQPEIVTTIADLRARVAAWRKDGARVGLVPTMGALHDGHLSLVRATGSVCQKVVVSIFVNPTQFAPHEDFDRYPRTLETDAAKLATTGKTDLIFAPTEREIYPDGFATKLEVGGPSAGLETDFRPHFFGGVATVVSKLLIAAMPDYAIFGEKDYQQLLVIRRMVKDLALSIEIAGGAIIREADGLAMSSRNAYLSAQDRKIAGRMNLILKDVIARLHRGDPIEVAEQFGKSDLLEAGFNSVDYVAPSPHPRRSEDRQYTVDR
jgi:pantoate--beta-alanine ligase